MVKVILEPKPDLKKNYRFLVSLQAFDCEMLHRIGVHFKLGAFMGELRKALWCQVFMNQCVMLQNWVSLPPPKMKKATVRSLFFCPDCRYRPVRMCGFIISAIVVGQFK